jgi:hypothetical protein
MVMALAAVALVECSTGDEKGDVWPIFLAQTNQQQWIRLFAG